MDLDETLADDPARTDDETPEPSAEPALAGNDGSAGDGDTSPSPDEPRLPRGKHRQPEDIRGWYMVLWALRPSRGERADWQEVGYYKAHEPAAAKRLALDHDARREKPLEERNEVARFLLSQANGSKRGILLRAVPAMHWLADVEPTTYVRPAPVLQIG